MDLRQLGYFEAVARQANFRRAAEELRIAQPSLSVQIQKLEAELGLSLLRRSTRHVSLTPAGELLLNRARVLLGDVASLRSELADIAAGIRGTVRLGATSARGSLDLPSAVAGFRALHPDVHVELRSGLIAELLADLDRGRLDLVLGPLHSGFADRYEAVELTTETLIVAAPPDWTPPPRASGRPGRLRVAELSEETFVCLPSDSGLAALLREAANAGGFSARVDFEADTPAGVRELIAAGLGIALLARSVALAPGPDIAVHALADAPGHPPIGLLARRGDRAMPAASELRAHLQTSA